VDLIKLPRTVSGNEYIAVFIDAFTRWPEAVAIPDKKASTVVRVMKEKTIALHGIPATLLSDEGSEFLSRLVTETCKVYGVTKVFSADYHSRGHGMVGRLNRTIEDRLKQPQISLAMTGINISRKPCLQYVQRLVPVLNSVHSASFMDRCYHANR
jgi:transposase InsO family protein